MKRFNTHVRTFDRAFQQRPEVLHPVRVNVAVNIAFRMIDYLVGIFVVQAIIREQFVSHYLGTLPDVLANEVNQFALAPRGDVMYTDLASVPFEQSEYDLFTPRAASMYLFLALVPMHEACRAADEGFVRFDRARHLVDRSVVGSVANAVHHEPRGFLRDFEGLPDFVAGDSVLAVGHHPHGAKPFVESNGGIL